MTNDQCVVSIVAAILNAGEADLASGGQYEPSSIDASVAEAIALVEAVKERVE